MFLNGYFIYYSGHLLLFVTKVAKKKSSTQYFYKKFSYIIKMDKNKCPKSKILYDFFQIFCAKSDVPRKM